MANLTVLAQGNTDAPPNEGNGVAGPLAAGINADSDKVMLPLATVSGTLASNNRHATNSTANLKGSAIRHSVAKTKTGATAASEVYSETLCFRTAYAGQEADSPAIQESNSDTNRAA